MKRRIGIALLVVAAALAGRAAAAEKVLHVLTWNEYFATSVLADFEERYDCMVAIDAFDSNEEMLDLLAGGMRADLITPSSYMATRMRRLGMLRDFDRSKLPNLPGLDNSFSRMAGDENNVFSIPYTLTVTGIGYNAQALPKLRRSWSVFASPALAKRATMLADMRETIGAALKFLGHSLNSVNPKEIDEAVSLLRLWRGNLDGFAVDQLNSALATGKHLAAHAYNGDMLMLMETNPGLSFFVPEEGAAISVDMFVLPKDTREPDLAQAFVDFLLTPEVAARNMQEVLYYMPIPEAVAMLPESLRSHIAFSVPESTLARCEVITDLDSGNALYEQAWEKITAE